MIELLNEIELALTDLLQSGLDTGGQAAVPRLRGLAARCEDMGLHTGSALLTGLEEALAARAHAVQKEDVPLAAAICRTARYLELCREKAQEGAIETRWAELAQSSSHENQNAGGSL